jgi:ATP-binding protein involved in chromosome partitioning
MLNQEIITQALKSVKYPGYTRDIVSFGIVKNIAVNAGAVRVSLQLTGGNAAAAAQIKAEVEKTLRAVPGVESLQVETASPPASGGGTQWSQQSKPPGVQRVVAVASGKGGVGKSTVAVNLACALARLGGRVGLLDCDIYGPSIPLMMGIRDKPAVSDAEKLVPPARHGVKLMSMGFLVEEDAPVIWRGPMIMKAIQQFITEVEWAPLDYLLVDLPPGTGDAQLTLCQTVPLDGGVIVTTPQEASLGVARKGIAMFEKVNVPILGIVENMSYFVTPNGERVEIFGHGGGRAEAQRRHLPFLGEIPIFTEIRESGDAGMPVVAGRPDGPAAAVFMALARALREKLG